MQSATCVADFALDERFPERSGSLFEKVSPSALAGLKRLGVRTLEVSLHAPRAGNLPIIARPQR